LVIFSYYLCRSQFVQRFVEGLISTYSNVLFNAFGVNFATVFTDNGGLVGKKRVLGIQLHSGGGACLDRCRNNAVGILGGNLLVQLLGGVYLNEGALSAKPHAAHAYDFDAISTLALLYRHLQIAEHLHRTGRPTPGRGAAMNPDSSLAISLLLSNFSKFD
jgi:hypothetical protein